MTSPSLHLFGHPESGHAFKVRFFMRHASIEHDYSVIDIATPRDQRPAIFRDNTRYGEVPMLLHDNRSYVQSGAILMHLARHFGLGGHPGMGVHGSRSASDKAQRAWRQCREWLLWEANKIGMCLPQLRGDKRFESGRLDPAVRQWLLARYEHDVGVMEHWLSDGKPWFVEGDNPSIVDFSLCGYLVFADEVEVVVPPNVQQWLMRLRDLPAWQSPYDMMAGEPPV